MEELKMVWWDLDWYYRLEMLYDNMHKTNDTNVLSKSKQVILFVQIENGKS